MTAILQSPHHPSIDANKFDIASLRPGQILTLECENGNKWWISLTDESIRTGDTLRGVMVMTNSANRGFRTGRPPHEMSIGRYAAAGKTLRIGFGHTETIVSYSVSNRPMGP